MRALLMAAAVLLTACASGSTPAGATRSPSPVPSSGFGVACRLPITWYPSDAEPDATNSGVGLFDAATGAISATAARPPLHFLTGDATYDPAAARWLPVPATAVSPDGLHYAYAEWDPPASGLAGGVHAASGLVIGTKGRVHLVDARTGADSIVYSGEPTYSVAGFGADGILLSRFEASMSGPSHSGLYVLKLGGATSPVLVAHSAIRSTAAVGP